MDITLRKGFKYSLLISSSVVSCFFFMNESYAFAFPEVSWRPVINLGGGFAIASDVGKSQNIPIQDPVTDMFFNYAAKRSTQTAGLFNVFLGGEFANCCSNILLQTGLDYSQLSHFTAKGKVTQGADIESADTFNYHYRVINRQLLVEAKVLYTIRECFYPYFLAGIGAGFNEAYHFHADNPPTLTFTRQYENKLHTSFSYAVGFGVDANVTPCVRVGFNYRFADFGRVRLGKAVIDNLNVSNTLKQSHIYAHELSTQLTFVL